MWKTSTLFLTCVLCFMSLIGMAQTTTPQPGTEGPAKIVKLYPNPASTTINFQIQQHNNDRSYDLIVYNFLGKKVDQVKNMNNRTAVNLDNYYSGVYIFQLRDQRGNLVESGKFNVVK